MRLSRPAAAVAIATALATVPGAAAASRGPRWPATKPIPLWIEGLNVPEVHREMVRRAAATWSRASAGALSFAETREFPSTGIRVRFVMGDVNFGEAAPYIDRRTNTIVRADVVLSIDSPGDALHKQLVLYLTALHELGHALGLSHTDDFGTIMYRFRRLADPQRYFLRYRKGLRSAEDIGSERATGLSEADLGGLRKLYSPEAR